MTTEEIVGNFRTERYGRLNEVRWNHFLSMGIPIADRTIFEPGAGIGDQTEWLLSQGAAHIYVNEGREDNLQIIQQRYSGNIRVSTLRGNIESCLGFSEFGFNVDLIFCYGVYYHLREDLNFTIMKQLSRLGNAIAFDYLIGNDNEVYYGYDNPSTSVSWYALRPRSETMITGLMKYWEYVYAPKTPLEWEDPVAVETRAVLAASHKPIESDGLILQ